MRKSRHPARQVRAVTLIALITALVTILMAAPFASATGSGAALGDLKAAPNASSSNVAINDFEQCENYPPAGSPRCPGGWTGGSLNTQNSDYAEDQVVPQRLVLALTSGSGTGHSVEITYMSSKGGIHAYDSLASWDFTQTQASSDRCAGLSGSDCVGGIQSTFSIPSDSQAAGHQLTGQNFVIYGGTITGTSSYSYSSSGNGNFTSLTVNFDFSSGSSKVMILWGGHLAASTGTRGWGAGLGASNISGEPFHMRITAVDGASIGNRDNQIASGAIQSQTTPTPTSTATNTPTSTSTPTNTATGTPTNTPTNSPTPTFTPTLTATGTPTATPTSTPTGTPTITATPTNTPTGTPTITATPTNTPTGTLVPTSTPTVTDTPTNTPTSTPTATPTNTPTGELVPTNTPTATNTPTSTPTKTPTSTPTTPPSNPPSNPPPPAPVVLGAVTTPSPTATPTKTPVPVILSASAARPAGLPKTGGAPEGLLLVILTGGFTALGAGLALRQRVKR